MSVDLGGFSPTDVKPGGGLDAIPAGKYRCVVTDSERKTTKAGDGAYLQLKIQVVEGEHKDRVLFDRLNLWNKNEQASQIAASQLSALCHAMGHLQAVSKSSDLHGKPFTVEVACREYQGRITNEIKNYVWKQDGEAGPAVGAASPDPEKPAWM